MRFSPGIGLSALGRAFGGFANDQEALRQRQRQVALDAQNSQSFGMQQEQHRASMANLTSEMGARDAAQRRQQMTEDVLGRDYQAALGGDRQAQARIVAVRPELANDFLPKAPPKPASVHTASQVNPSTGMVEDVFDDGRRQVVRKATADEVAKATHVPDSGQGAMDEQRKFLRAQALQGDFKTNPTVKNAYGVATAVTGLKAGLAGDSPMDDLSIIYETVKMFDPNSAVREGEIHLAQSASSLPAQLRLTVEHWNSGRKITPEMRAQVQSLLDRKVGESRAAIAPIQSEAGSAARRYGVAADSAYIAPDPFRGIAPPKQGLSPGERTLMKARGYTDAQLNAKYGPP